MKRGIASFVAFVIVAASTPAFSATLSSVEGPDRAVQANRGSGFVVAAAGSEVRSGDRILLQEGGRTRITYDNGCSLVLDKPGLYDVPNDPDCQNGIITPTQAIAGTGIAVGIGILIYQATKPSSP